MATVYSLVCWGGSTGKSVTVSSSTDYVTLTNHGLRNGKGVQFVSGTLPTVSGTALALNTTYYAKYISSSTYELYYDSGLTSKIDFTSTGASLVLRGQYYQSLTDKSRWTGATERIYDGLTSWHTGRGGATVFDTEVCELGEDFDDIASAFLTINIPAASIVITSMVNGVRSSAFHFGVIGAGFARQCSVSIGNTCLNCGAYRITIDGFSIVGLGSGYGFTGFGGSKAGCAARNMLIYRTTYNNASYGVSFDAQLCDVVNCLIFGFNSGVRIYSTASGCLVANNVITGCYQGFSSNLTNTRGYYYNNISFGNVSSNWPALTSYEGAANNAGASGDTIWDTVGSTAVTVASTDFIDSAGNDFRPAASTSPQVDAGTSYYGMLGFDIAGNESPNYNNGGAEVVDIGCYEYDHGYGNHPASTNVTFLGVVAGSEIHVYDSEDNELVGTESCTANQSLTWGIPTNPNVKITIIKRGLRWMKFTYLSEEGPQTIPIFPQPDLGYNNPA